jgi:D-3-phosphoglycerate dehydrogenase
MKILANDGISPEGIERLEKNGFEVVTEKVAQEDLAQAINDENYIGLLVRSATTVRKELIDKCDGLKFIGRGGVGMDNIDVDYAREKGLVVANTPASSSQSVAELVLGSLFSLSRSTFDSYKQMPINGKSEFKKLKKKYSKGIELRGRTLLIVGFGRIGQSLAGYALGAGMKVKAVDIQAGTVEIPVEIEGAGTVVCKVQVSHNLDEVIGQADFISLHVPKQADGSAVISKKEIDKMRDGVRLVNASRGGVIDENDLIDALNSGKVAAAALDVFDNEPTPSEKILEHEGIACTPHIGAATNEAQARIGLELADTIIKTLK